MPPELMLEDSLLVVLVAFSLKITVASVLVPQYCSKRTTGHSCSYIECIHLQMRTHFLPILCFMLYCQTIESQNH